MKNLNKLILTLVPIILFSACIKPLPKKTNRFPTPICKESRESIICEYDKDGNGIYELRTLTNKCGDHRFTYNNQTGKLVKYEHKNTCDINEEIPHILKT